VSIDEPARQLTWQRMGTTLDGMRQPNPETGLPRSSESVGGRRGSVTGSTRANCATRSPTPSGPLLIVARAPCFELSIACHWLWRDVELAADRRHRAGTDLIVQSIVADLEWRQRSLNAGGRLLHRDRLAAIDQL
jgi:hypothetical protein